LLGLLDRLMGVARPTSPFQSLSGGGNQMDEILDKKKFGGGKKKKKKKIKQKDSRSLYTAHLATVLNDVGSGIKARERRIGF